MPPKRKATEDVSTPRRATRRRPLPSADVTPTGKKDARIDEPDELNLSSAKPLVPPSTPGSRYGTPRIVMDCVEIVTPRALALRTNITCVSPVPTGLKPKAPILKAPTTPSRQSRLEPASPSLPIKATFPLAPSWPRPPLTPNNVPTTPSRRSPKRGHVLTSVPSPLNLPVVLPVHLAPCLRLQKRAILEALKRSLPPEDTSDRDGESTNDAAYTQLYSLLHGTVMRGEGNSCLLLGPRGSGKTSLVERAIKDLAHEPIILRLSGYTQHNDRLALREIARQLSQQTGKSFLRDVDEDPNGAEEERNPFIDPGPTVSIPPPSHLPVLVSVLPTLSRPTVVILDAFDLFAHHARQSLLYCLLDTVQSCKVGQGINGLAVVGITTRIDTINQLEKRVKSRFSGRMIRTAPPSDLLRWMTISRRVLNTPLDDSNEWNALWSFAVQAFLDDRKVMDAMRDTFALSRDVRMLKQMLTAVVADLRMTSPFPTACHMSGAVSSQRLRQQFSGLQALSYPSICLLVAAMHAYSAGHDIVTFEMLYGAFREEFRASSAAPIQIEGGSIGMAKCSREVLMRSFEELVGKRMFTSAVAPSPNIAPEFVRYRCLVERRAVKQAVNAMGQTNVKKWLNKVS